ncbi:peptidase U32 family protein [Maridesulfovibrio hydrothermalis]|uniref:Peptidase U32 n=1 Tax=Maridesulfovibrio hydrothermalis AM13 = DSM 14728 TaxID=1121451 RepID=L0RC78_9BACT|nr:peptidase U32 family protein [Maridesulfovibrio hydrothermalis]CCO24354.1 Peptidase U32 [Maridesulfovibrio hydrothermalis AM13 = DSM 14728]
MNEHKPEILAPAGDKQSFLAAIAAGADAVYAGLKHFSARMEAYNFSTGELAALAQLGRKNGVKTYIPMNTLVKPDDMDSAARLIDRVARTVKPDALIIQDIAMIEIAHQAGFEGELHLSTLANVSHPKALKTAAELGINRVVVPRELNLDEIKEMAAACPENMSLEMFVHGALCYSVSGRCYWSSFFGGKSSLRGRCVQPCRRLYGGAKRKEQPKRLFSCLDLSLDVLTKPTLSIPEVTSWKIEGRKKGPHYVYYTVTAYRMLRDNPNDAQKRKNAMELLELALGRPSSHSVFLPQRPFTPLDPSNETGSGFLIGITKQEKNGKPYFNCRQELLNGDFLRIGYQDQPGHQMLKIRKSVPKRGRVSIPVKSKTRLKSGTKVFLIDRREEGLVQALKKLESKLSKIKVADKTSSSLQVKLPQYVYQHTERVARHTLQRNPPKGKTKFGTNIWLSLNALKRTPRPAVSKIWWHLPPVIWPDEEAEVQKTIDICLSGGGRNFVLNAPWQKSLFPKDDRLRFHAGPFCNVSNPLAVAELEDMGFSSAYVSPELAREDFLALPSASPLPLGVVLTGMWPLGISRIIADEANLMSPMYSQKKEICWVRQYGQNYWVYPGWPLDFSEERKVLENAGYAMFLDIQEPWPKDVPEPVRTSNFNWDLALL